MRLFIGETPSGIPLEPEGFVAVCRMGPNASGTLLHELENLGPNAPVLEDGMELPSGEGEEEVAVAEEEEQAAEDDDDDIFAEDEDELDEGEPLDEDEERAAIARELQEVADIGPPGMTDDAEGLVRPKRVWVLMGGDPDQATASLRSGLEVVRRLSKFSDLLVGRWVSALL